MTRDFFHADRWIPLLRAGIWSGRLELRNIFGPLNFMCRPENARYGLKFRGPTGDALRRWLEKKHRVVVAILSLFFFVCLTSRPQQFGIGGVLHCRRGIVK